MGIALYSVTLVPSTYGFYLAVRILRIPEHDPMGNEWWASGLVSAQKDPYGLLGANLIL